MHKLYQKSELGFALCCIAFYVVGTSAADELSRALGAPKAITVVWNAILTAALLLWAGRHGLFQKYGLCKTALPAAKFLFYLPLLLLATCNLWLGVTQNMPALETVLYILSMLMVGFLEEFIFRGLLFRAMRQTPRAAVIVSSLTFGIGHLVNLVNGSGADLLSNLLQVGYATAFGFMTVIIFSRGGSLLPCIAVHSTVNALNAFAAPPKSLAADIAVSVLLGVIAAAYTLILLKMLPKPTE